MGNVRETIESFDYNKASEKKTLYKDWTPEVTHKGYQYTFDFTTLRIYKVSDELYNLYIEPLNPTPDFQFYSIILAEHNEYFDESSKFMDRDVLFYASRSELPWVIDEFLTNAVKQGRR